MKYTKFTVKQDTSVEGLHLKKGKEYSTKVFNRSILGNPLVEILEGENKVTNLVTREELDKMDKDTLLDTSVELGIYDKVHYSMRMDEIIEAILKYQND